MQNIIERILHAMNEYEAKTGKPPTKIALGIDECHDLRELFKSSFTHSTYEDQVMGLKLYKTNKFNELEVAR